MSRRYIYICTSGRGFGGKAAHLPAPTGNLTRCGLLLDRGWELWPYQPHTTYGRRRCHRCWQQERDHA